MKISKLFHWLYASLMLLPLMVFGVTGLYYGLNQNAQLSETTTQEEINVNFNQLVIEGYPNYGSNQSNYIETTADNYYNDDGYWIFELDNNAYYIKWSTLQENINNSNYLLKMSIFNEYSTIEQVDIYSTVQDNNYIHESFDILNSDDFIDYEFRFDYSNLLTNIAIRFETTEYCELAITNVQIFDITYMFGNDEITNQEFNSYFPLTYYQPTERQTIEMPIGSPITNTNDISTSIINAWNSTWQNPLFSWSSDSFLIAPFNYITDLFSIPQNNTFSMALSYWLAISIVYLVFDLVMYVPLLAHRWIDKGMVE